VAGKVGKGMKFNGLDIPDLYATEKIKDPMVYACYEVAFSRWKWFVTEYDGQQTFFGLVSGFELELGYFDRLELEENGCKLVEGWEAKPLSQVRAELAAA
jgi:hypothetical protein